MSTSCWHKQDYPEVLCIPRGILWLVKVDKAGEETLCLNPGTQLSTGHATTPICIHLQTLPESLNVIYTPRNVCNVWVTQTDNHINEFEWIWIPLTNLPSRPDSNGKFHRNFYTFKSANCKVFLQGWGKNCSIITLINILLVIWPNSWHHGQFNH